MKFTILLIAWSGLLFWSGFVFGWRLRETTEKPAGGGIVLAHIFYGKIMKIC